MYYVIAWVAVKFGIKLFTNFMWQGRVKLPISNTTRVVLSHIFTAIPILFHVNTILADFCGCFHVLDVQIVLLQNI